MKAINKNDLSSTKYSVLDLVPIVEGVDAQEAIKRSVNLAQHTEQLGFHRFWISEHHNMESLASASPVILIGHIAQQTTTSKLR